MASRGKFNQSTTVQWSDGTNFDGYILIATVLPSGSSDWTYSTIAGQTPQRLPSWMLVPIVAGKFNSSSSALYTASLAPPNTRYACWYYDSTKKQIAGPSALFTVSTDPFTPPSLTLTVPSVGVTIPTPDAVPSESIPPNGIPYYENISGTKNGVNTAFTISRAARQLVVYYNGVALQLNTGYTWSPNTTAITALAPFVPESGESYVALYFV